MGDHGARGRTPRSGLLYLTHRIDELAARACFNRTRLKGTVLREAVLHVMTGTGRRSGRCCLGRRRIAHDILKRGYPFSIAIIVKNPAFFSRIRDFGRIFAGFAHVVLGHFGNSRLPICKNRAEARHLRADNGRFRDMAPGTWLI